MLNQLKRANQGSKEQLEQIKDLMGLLRRHPQILVLFERFKISIDEFDKIEVGLKEMDVSAKTKDGKIWINKCLVDDGNLVEDLHYVCHELVHWLQQRTGLDSWHEPDNYSSYLFIPTEIQAFKEQIEFIRSYKGAKEAKKYLKELLDFHELEGDERKELEGLLGGDSLQGSGWNLVRAASFVGFDSPVQFIDSPTRTTVMVENVGDSSDLSGRDPNQGFADFEDLAQAVAFARRFVGQGTVSIYLPPDVSDWPEHQRVWENKNDLGWSEQMVVHGRHHPPPKPIPHLGSLEDFGLELAKPDQPQPDQHKPDKPDQTQPDQPQPDSTKTAAPHHVRIDVRDSEGRQLQHLYLKRRHCDRPAGRIEGSEEPVEAAVRELEERTGFRAGEDDLVLVGENEGFWEFEGDFEGLEQVGEPQTQIRLKSVGGAA